MSDHNLKFVGGRSFPDRKRLLLFLVCWWGGESWWFHDFNDSCCIRRYVRRSEMRGWSPEKNGLDLSLAKSEYLPCGAVITAILGVMHSLQISTIMAKNGVFSFADAQYFRLVLPHLFLFFFFFLRSLPINCRGRRKNSERTRAFSVHMSDSNPPAACLVLGCNTELSQGRPRNQRM